MSFAETAFLGGLSGMAIYISLPFGRVAPRKGRPNVAIAMFSVGVLLFIFLDVLSNASPIIDSALEAAKRHRGSAAYLCALVSMLSAGFAAGTVGPAAIAGRMRRRGRGMSPMAGDAGAPVLAAAPSGVPSLELTADRRWTLGTGLTIATAIGVHNFAEGLAIGVSARAGAVTLATVLIVGFAIHNASEGSGIVGPLGDVTPSWAWLGLAGLIAGGPTFLGSIVGYGISSRPLELAAYAIAGGAIIYVAGEIWTAMRRHGHHELGLLMLSAGFVIALVSDLIVTLGGG
jgi:zinc transporter, ZIP family